jgi:hypothetical protein
MVAPEIDPPGKSNKRKTAKRRPRRYAADMATILDWPETVRKRIIEEVDVTT